LTKGLLAKVEDSSLAKTSRTVFLKQEVVDLAAMEGETNGLLLAIGDGLSRWLVRGNSDEGDLPWGRFGDLSGEEGKVDFFDDAEHSLGLEWGTVQTLLDLGSEASIDGLGIQPLDDFAVSIANAHRLILLDKCLPVYPVRHMSRR
jgi:hypothetical protein